MGCSLCCFLALCFIPLTPFPARVELFKAPLEPLKAELVQEEPSRRLAVLCGVFREMMSPGVSWGADAEVSSRATGPVHSQPSGS